MPNYENNNMKGSLYITFDVEFPKVELSAEQKKGVYCAIEKSLFLFVGYTLVFFNKIHCYMP